MEALYPHFVTCLRPLDPRLPIPLSLVRTSFRLKLRTIISLIPEDPTYDLTEFCEKEGVNLLHFAAEKFKDSPALFPHDFAEIGVPPFPLPSRRPPPDCGFCVILLRRRVRRSAGSSGGARGGPRGG